MYQAHSLSSGARPELKSKNIRRACQDVSLPSPCSDTSGALGRQGDSLSDMLLHRKRCRCSRSKTKCLSIHLHGPRCEPVRSNAARPKRLYIPAVVLREPRLSLTQLSCKLACRNVNLNLHATMHGNAANGACDSCTWHDQPAACLKKLRSLAHVNNYACIL